MQNSDVSFLTYSFSDSFFRRFRNSCRTKESDGEQADRQVGG